MPKVKATENPDKSGKMAEKPDMSGKRTRTFAFLVYPDSAPQDWREKLTEAHVQALVSPLHDQDVNPDGSQKKPHWHVLIIYDGMKSYEQAAQLRDSMGGVGWENVASTRGYARYLCHLDNPEKAQYSADGVIEYGGADYSDIIRRAADATRAVRDMMEYIREHDVRFYSDFLEYCMDERPDWFETLITRNTYAIYTYIKARSAKAEMCARMRVDPETGEVIG